MAPPAPSSFMQPGAEVTKVDHNVSPGGSQARAAATQTDYAAPAGTYKTDPMQNPHAPVANTSTPPAYANVNTVATDHDPSLHFSSPGLQARAAAAGQAPQGTAQPEYNLLSSQPPPSGQPPVSPMGAAPDAVASSSPAAHLQQPPQRVPYEPITSLNTAREVFQPTSANQPQPDAMDPPAYQNQPPQSQPEYVQPGQQLHQQPAQPAYTAPEKPYSFSPQQPKQAFNYTYVPTDSASPSSQPMQSQSTQSPGGTIARTAATQTAKSAPPGTRSATTVNVPGYRSLSETARHGTTYQSQAPSAAPPSQPPQFSAGAASPGMAARAAAIKGAHPAGTGPDAGVVGIKNFAAQQAPRVDVSHHFSPAGAAARAAAAGEAPSGTVPAYPKNAASQEMSYEAPSINPDLSPEAQVSPAGMQARQLAYGMHPAGTGPGSVSGRSFSTMAGPARRAVPRISPALLRRKGGVVVGAAAALLFSS